MIRHCQAFSVGHSSTLGVVSASVGLVRNCLVEKTNQLAGWNFCIEVLLSFVRAIGFNAFFYLTDCSSYNLIG